jgi:hypothetical protein
VIALLTAEESRALVEQLAVDLGRFGFSRLSDAFDRELDARAPDSLTELANLLLVAVVRVEKRRASQQRKELRTRRARLGA